ncbi:MAG: PKD domain-containing protein [Bacteroidales bacterium]
MLRMEKDDLHRTRARLKAGMFLIGSVILMNIPVKGQISAGGIPASRAIKASAEIPFVILSVPEKNRVEQADTGARTKALVFAHPVEVNISPENSGKWETLPDGTRIWRVGIRSPGAYSLNLLFKRYVVPAGARVFVYDPGGKHTLGAFTGANNKPSGVLAVMPVPGDELVVEYNLPAGVEETGELLIGQVGHDFFNIMPLLDSRDGSYGQAGDCNLDINCAPGYDWQEIKRSVVRLLINSSTLCSGVLLNNTARDGHPYMLTAQHCIDSAELAAGVVTVFNYESSYCNGPDMIIDHSISGTGFLASSIPLDFTLVELSEAPPREFKPWYAGWSTLPDPATHTVSIHHPSGDVKKIAWDDDPPETTTFTDPSDTVDYVESGFWKVLKWEGGTTEGGSSGAPLFNPFGQVVGVLTGGEAFCGRPWNDYYTKISFDWDYFPEQEHQLKAWLDGVSTGEASIGGMDPYAGEARQADFTWHASRICEGDPVVFTDLSSGNIMQWDWNFGLDASPATASGRGPHKVHYATVGNKTVQLTITTENGQDVAIKSLPLTEMDDPPVPGFSYEEEEPRKIRFTDLSDNTLLWYWDFGDFRTSTVQEPVHTYMYEGSFQVHQRVANGSCLDTIARNVLVTSIFHPEEDRKSLIVIFPQPARGYCYLRLDDPAENDWHIRLVHIGGSAVREWILHAGTRELFLDLQGLAPGVYILRGRSGQASFAEKITVE